MKIRLIAPRESDMPKIRQWRSAPGVRLGLRTPFLLTEKMQADFYENVINDRGSAHRYWSVVDENNRLVAFAGLTDISWENGHGEISLLVSPEQTGEGVGKEAVRGVLREAFERMRLVTVFGECYEHNPAWEFWLKMLTAFTISEVPSHTSVPRRKFWEGRLHAGQMFWFTANDWWGRPQEPAHPLAKPPTGVG